MPDGSTSLEAIAGQRFSLKLSSACAIAGGGGFLAVGVAHGDLPDDDVGAALRFVADHPQWYATHLAGIVCVLLWVGAFTGLAHSLRGGVAAVLGRLATVSMGVGAAVFTVDYTIDGYAFKRIADQWAAAASGPAAERYLTIADAMFAVLYGTVTASAMWTLGLPFLLIGLAVAADHEFPRWLGWIVAVTGGGSVAGGLITYLAWHPGAGFVLALACNALSAGWLVAVGVLMWRRARALTTPEVADRTGRGGGPRAPDQR
ncbi:hypothetical protein [Nocardia iowensis]|uniref:DUF4386 family protein n=1 Tax=Nocardia iowensis TaxID=204891 RepID=A0ABX8RKQ1_NOCIO|nr:hypothetical protein [Nocardia iowensis]QXN89906.1 hypothetical protein KV110_31290 [Nocardia iowensis]